MITTFVILLASCFALLLALGQLFVRKKNHTSLVLITLLSSCGIWLGHAGFKLIGFEHSSQHIYLIYIPFFCLSGPMWYLFLKCLFENYHPQTREAFLIMPSMFCFLLAFPFYLQTAEFKIKYKETDLYNFVTISVYLSDRLAEIVVIISLIFSLIYLIRLYTKPNGSPNYRSIQLTISITIVCLVAAVLRIFGVFIGSQTFRFVVPSILVSVGMIIIYCFSYRYPILLNLRLSQNNHRPSMPEPEQHHILEGYKNKIQQESWYLDPELNLEKLANQLGISTHRLSELVNVSTGKNYNSFINEFRIEHAKKCSLHIRNVRI